MAVVLQHNIQHRIFVFRTNMENVLSCTQLKLTKVQILYNPFFIILLLLPQGISPFKQIWSQLKDFITKFVGCYDVEICCLNEFLQSFSQLGAPRDARHDVYGIDGGELELKFNWDLRLVRL